MGFYEDNRGIKKKIADLALELNKKEEELKKMNLLLRR
jgi:hypothetical protein